MLEWVAISFSRGSSWPRDLTCNSCISYFGRQILYHCTTRGPSSQGSVQSLSRVRLSSTPWIAAHQVSLSITNSRSWWCHPAISSSVVPFSSCPSPHIIRVFSNESNLRIRWPKYWSFSFSINPSSEHPGLISFRMNWLDLLAVQGTLKSFLQHHSFKHQFFGAQLSSQSNSHIHTWPLEKP